MKHPCEICKGACCESMLFVYPSGLPIMDEFYAARGRLYRAEGVIELETRCPNLIRKTGKCGIYACRPQVCKDYAVGSTMCRRTIALRRPGRTGEDILAAIEHLNRHA